MRTEAEVRAVRDGAALVVRIKDATGQGDPLQTAAVRSLVSTLGWVLGEVEEP